MGGLKLSVHPLFFPLGLYYALTGRILVFVVFTLTAVVHELGHSLKAAAAGYRLDKIVLTPFGAVVKGDIKGLNPTDEIKIALAGPAVNFAVGTAFVALWWIFPETYAYTDVAATANFSLAAINLLPAYPLDGGRVLYALIQGAKGEKVATVTAKVTGAVLGAAFCALFVFSLFSSANFTVLFFAAFILFGAFSDKGAGKYVKTYFSLSDERLKKGLRVKSFAISANAPVKKLLALSDGEAINRAEVYENGVFLTEIGQEEITAIIEKGGLYEKIGDYL